MDVGMMGVGGVGVEGASVDVCMADSFGSGMDSGGTGT